MMNVYSIMPGSGDQDVVRVPYRVIWNHGLLWKHNLSLERLGRDEDLWTINHWATNRLWDLFPPRGTPFKQASALFHVKHGWSQPYPQGSHDI